MILKSDYCTDLKHLWVFVCIKEEKDVIHFNKNQYKDGTQCEKTCQIEATVYNRYDIMAFYLLTM